MALRWPSGFRGRVIILVVGVGLLAVEWLATARAFERSVESINTIFDNAMPSVSYLAQVQGTISDLARDMRRLDRATGPAARAWTEREVEVLLRSMHRVLREYERFPVYPDEPEARTELRATLEALATEATALIREPDPALRRQRRLEAFYPALDAANAVVRDLLRLNADQASRSAHDTVDAHETAVRSSLALTVSLNGVLVVLWLLLGRQIAQTERERERRMQELDAFGGRVAHDLKSPLSTIIMSAQVMRAEPALDEKAARTLERIERASRRMNGMIEGLLAFAKAGTSIDRAARTSVPEVLASIESTLAPTLEAERVAYVVDAEPGLCAGTSEGVFSSIAQNLIRNAVTHLGEVPTREVRVRARSLSQTRLELEVADTGPGIPDDVKRRLFRPFERGSTSAAGHGLGLATVKRLVDGLGGTITVDTEVGRGTTFRVALPRAAAPPA